MVSRDGSCPASIRRYSAQLQPLRGPGEVRPARLTWLGCQIYGWAVTSANDQAPLFDPSKSINTIKYEYDMAAATAIRVQRDWLRKKRQPSSPSLSRFSFMREISTNFCVLEATGVTVGQAMSGRRITSRVSAT